VTIEHIKSFICMKVAFGFAFNLSHAFMYYIFVCLKTSRCSNVKRIMWMNEVKYDRIMSFLVLIFQILEGNFIILMVGFW